MSSVVSAPTSLGRWQMTLDVKSRLLRAVMPKRMVGMSLKRLQLKSRSVRLVRNAKFCGRELRTFLEMFNTSRSY